MAESPSSCSKHAPLLVGLSTVPPELAASILNLVPACQPGGQLGIARYNVHQCVYSFTDLKSFTGLTDADIGQMNVPGSQPANRKYKPPPAPDQGELCICW